MIYDPKLSKAGSTQVNKLKMKVENEDGIPTKKIELVITSPLTRAIDTCLGSFFPNDTTEKRLFGDKPLVCPLTREKLHKSGDIGISCSSLKEKYGNNRLDFSVLEQHQHPEQWWYDEEELPNGGPLALVQESAHKTKKRCKMFLEWLSKREETYIVVVCHSYFIKHLTNMSRKLNNCEIKKYDLSIQPTNTNVTKEVVSMEGTKSDAQ